MYLFNLKYRFSLTTVAERHQRGSDFTNTNPPKAGVSR